MTKGITAVSPSEFALMLDAFKIKYIYHEPITSMDLFGALIGNVLLRDFGNDRYQVYLSEQQNLLVNGDWPLPIYTVLDGSKVTHRLDRWYEFTPYEVGGTWLNHYIPTWAFGRRFAQGVSVADDPEVGLAFLFGLFGSAFGVDIHRVWYEVSNTINAIKKIENVVQKTILNQIGDKRITKSEEFNFTAGMPKSPLRDQKYMVFVDAGFASGIPYPAVSGERPERNPDILIFCEMSENVATINTDIANATSELRVSERYAKTHKLKFPPIPTVLPQAITIYKDETDPSVPVVIWMPFMRDELKWNQFGAHDARFAGIANFDISQCVKSFCPSANFTYTPMQAEQVMTLSQFCMHACTNEIREAVAWKMAQLDGLL
jgi:phospholipase A2